MDFIMKKKPKEYENLEDDEIDNLIQKFDKLLYDSMLTIKKKVNLDPEMAILGHYEKFDNYYLCQICFQVIILPIECKECQNCFCKWCIEEWQLKNSQCPICKNVFQENQMHRHLKNKLNEIKFKCPLKCDTEPIKYDNLMEHVRVHCPNSQTKCPLNCQSELIYKSKLKEHLKYQCNNMSQTCKKCQTQVQLKEKQNHNCIISLKSMINDKNKVINNMQKDINKYKEEISKFSIKQKILFCPKNHLIEKCMGMPQFYLQIGMVQCDKCKIPNLEQQQFYFRCYQRCTYDICNNCYKIM